MGSAVACVAVGAEGAAEGGVGAGLGHGSRGEHCDANGGQHEVMMPGSYLPPECFRLKRLASTTVLRRICSDWRSVNSDYRAIYLGCPLKRMA
jgi:hypothetical protein